MTQEIDYEKLVKKATNGAYCDSGDANDYTTHYWITTPALDAICQCIGNEENLIKHAAWESAYNHLKQQGKL